MGVTDVRSRLPVAPRISAPAVSVAAVLVLCSGVLTALVLPAASDSTSVLRHPVLATVTPEDGSPAAAHDGQILHPGDTVTVARGGGGEITTGPRKLWLGASGTQVRIDGPASTELRRGSVVAVDPGRAWSLQADQVAVTGITGAVRIDYDFNVRVADYTGRATLGVPTGGGANLVGLDQIDASGPVLQGSPSPLTLRDDVLDTTAAPSLVQLDRGLVALAGQVDADPYLLADYPSIGENPSEKVLPAAIGAAGSGGSPTARAQAALAARQQHGSWGVIAERLGAGLPGVRAALSALLDSPSAQARSLAAPASQSVANAGAAAEVSASPPPPAAGPAVRATPSPTDASRVTAPATGGPAVSGGPIPVATPARPVVSSASSRPSSAPTAPTPSSTPTPLLNALLDTVGGLLPSPDPLPIRLGGPIAASPTPSAGATASPSPTPLVKTLVNTVSSLLGGSGH